MIRFVMFREFLTIVTFGTIYLYLLMLLSLGLERWVEFRRRFTLPFWIVALAVLVVSASAVVIYHDVASSIRQDITTPTDEERRADDPIAHEARVSADRARFVEQARRGFYLLCAGIVLLTGAASIWIGRRSSERSLPTSIAFLAIMFVYFTFSLLYVEYQNSCKIGDSFLIDQHCR